MIIRPALLMLSGHQDLRPTNHMQTDLSSELVITANDEHASDQPAYLAGFC